MSNPILGVTSTRVTVEATRPRQTPASAPGRFRQVLLAGADALLAGAGLAASGLPGGPLVSAAIGAAREGVARVQARSGSATSAALGGAGAGTGASTGTGATTGSNPELDAMRKLQQEGQSANLVYLQLQEQVAQDNRRYTTISNLLKAKHDTARGALSNLRV